MWRITENGRWEDWRCPRKTRTPYYIYIYIYLDRFEKVVVPKGNILQMHRLRIQTFKGPGGSLGADYVAPPLEVE